MKYQILGSNLIITIDPEEQRELQQNIDENGEPSLEDCLEPLVCNSELAWIFPEETGDLTDAPMLGILGEEQPGAGSRFAGLHVDENNMMQSWFHPILNRWAYMDYQVKSPVLELAKNGRIVFVGGNDD